MVDGQNPQAGEQAVPMQVDGVKQPFDLQEELIALLKTAHPLLAVTMETMAEQIRERLKPSTEEETYRWLCQTLMEALQASTFNL
jgi:transformation/transcription domain-associated protein